MKQFLRRILSFGAVPLFSLISPLLLLPLLSRHIGSSGWAALAVGQSLGALSAVAVNLGYTLRGPSLVAGADLANRHAILTQSFVRRAASLAVCACVGVPLILGLVDTRWFTLALLMYLAMAVTGMSPGWYWIGIAKPRAFLTFEAIPKLVGLAIALVIILGGGSPVFYPTMLLATTTLGLLAFHATIGFRQPNNSVRRKLGLPSAMLAELSASAYATSPITIGAITLSVNALASLSSADRVYRLGLYVISVLSAAVQSWVFEQKDSVHQRLRVAFFAHLAVGVFGCVVLVVLGAPLTSLLFGSRLQAPVDVVGAYGCAYLAVSLNTTLGRHFLISVNSVRGVLASTLFGGVVGLPLMFLAGHSTGSAGIAWAFAVSEGLVVVVQLVIYGRLRVSSTRMRKASV